MEVLNDILGYKNRKIFQDTDCFSFSLDSIMLANFATIRLKDKKIVDLLEQIGDTFKILLAMMISISVMLMIGITLVIKISNSALMYR